MPDISLARSKMLLLSGTANRPLAEEIAAFLGQPLCQVTIRRFADGEIFIRIDENVRGQDVYIIQPTNSPGENIIELLILIDAARRASAARISAVIPYFGYARQDRKDEGRVPITAKLVANLLTVAGTDRVLTLDLHAAQIQGFFDIPVDNLSAEPVITAYVESLNVGPITLVSPDIGNAKRARVYAEHLGGELAIIDKRRVSGTEAASYNIIGDIKDKSVLMVDDMIATAGTVSQAARLVRERGVKRVIAAATHGVLCGPAVERLAEVRIDHLAITDSIPLKEEARRRLPNLTVLTISELLGEAMRRIHCNESVSSLFMR